MARRGNSERWAFWELAVQMQAESGLPIAKFCERESLSQASFYAWRRKLQQRDAEGRTVGDSGDGSQGCPRPRLVPVQLVEDRPAAVVEVVSPAGMTVRVPDGAATENVRRVLGLLHEIG
jgi:transposase